jgi:hypothetical protein
MSKNLIRSIVAVVILAGLIVVVLPNFLRPRTHSAQNACINILRQLDGAKQQWALENHKTTNDIPTLDDIKPYIKLNSRGEIPRCPDGGIYIPGRVGESPKCSVGGEQHTLP